MITVPVTKGAPGLGELMHANSRLMPRTQEMMAFPTSFYAGSSSVKLNGARVMIPLLWRKKSCMYVIWTELLDSLRGFSAWPTKPAVSVSDRGPDGPISFGRGSEGFGAVWKPPASSAACQQASLSRLNRERCQVALRVTTQKLVFFRPVSSDTFHWHFYGHTR